MPQLWSLTALQFLSPPSPFGRDRDAQETGQEFPSWEARRRFQIIKTDDFLHLKASEEHKLQTTSKQVKRFRTDCQRGCWGFLGRFPFLRSLSNLLSFSKQFHMSMDYLRLFWFLLSRVLKKQYHNYLTWGTKVRQTVPAVRNYQDDLMN